MSKTRSAILLFVVAVVFGPLYTASGYSSVTNVISELAAQNTPHNYAMSAAFLILGIAIVVDGMRAFRPPLLPFIAFGLFFGAAGLFGHKPIATGIPYSVWRDEVHSALATLSGISLTVGFVWQAVRAGSTGYRLLVIALAILCVALPLLMLKMPAYQGLIQRGMYLAVFGWLWAFYPKKA